MNAIALNYLACSGRISISAIKALVTAEFGVDPIAFLGDCRSREVAHPRQIAMYLARKLTGRSLTVIGRAFDRDHTTVIGAVRAVEARMARDVQLANGIAAMKARLRDRAAAGEVPDDAEDLAMEFAGLLREALRRDPVKLLQAVQRIARGET